MSEYNSYAVLGAGRVGTVFIRTLLATKPTASIVIFTRSASKSSTLPAEITNSSQVKIVVVDYTSVSSLSFALKEHAVEVVVDTVLMMSAAFHNVVADAAKEAGTVKLFVPSEFGFVTEDAVGPHAVKSAVHKHLKEIGLPYMVVQCGLFTELIPVVAQSQSGKFHIVGSGDKQFSTTSLEEVAGFLVHLLTTSPASALEFTSHRLQGSRITFKEAAAKFKLPVESVDIVPVQGSSLGMNFQTQLQMLIDSGRGSTGWSYTKNEDDLDLATSGNKLWEGHVWKTVEDVHKL